ncbi:aspartokinase [Clostridium pasteurianum DSM 525 = ATCC 6013]|uniref:Aspartokinase n=1 Tax=Clostridium pasteurianum DSM 525 = ATCC 6013 TaxID=1262449 RepID=A0A0H3J3D6_CLOPA|nr:aspartate kinase [Clostridium pasteurianum]AJA47332.1 aspartokinase [Clostridium pasteurianum DSM 525 = ATCC 6013]AJA51320.1 aspartokinase [Clostridium pasteurianum DSM 525 = ATCC 6013]AOZ74667.1 aspartate kinase [Clostridium pasteurianum DSM 525 = ATCC 6013]AOZ78464.1 aspartate kinase [Clostridium pasteurianum]ELP58669.1 aspartokinase [Clostridium pasteurianum DSM 525 = ATCC 6013]
MPVIVQKYSGSSLSTIDKMKKVAEAVVNKKEEGNKVVVVVSAMNNTTDRLINLAKKISDEPDKRELDVLLSTGEMASASLLAMTIKEMGCDAVSYTAYQIGMRTVGDYGNSLIADLDDRAINRSLRKDKVVIIAGFQGINWLGDITTLGRGGSDTTAVAIAVKLNAICEIYTYADGIYDIDPREYKYARKLEEIDYEEVIELTSLGAQLLHLRAIELAQKYKIPIHVRLSFSDVKGTVIKEVNTMNMESKPITGIATSDEDVAVTIKDIYSDINIISNLFEALASKKINVDMISQTAPIDGRVNVSFTIPKENIETCLNIIDDFAERENVYVDKDIDKFSVVGIGMKSTSGVAARMFKLFSDNGIEVKMITTSQIRITCAIKQSDKQKAVDLVIKNFRHQ